MKMMGAPVVQKRSRSGGNLPTWASKTCDEARQYACAREDGAAGAAGAAGTAEAEEKIKQNGSESSLEVEISNVLWVAEPPQFPAHRRGAV